MNNTCLFIYMTKKFGGKTWQIFDGCQFFLAKKVTNGSLGQVLVIQAHNCGIKEKKLLKMYLNNCGLKPVVFSVASCSKLNHVITAKKHTFWSYLSLYFVEVFVGLSHIIFW